MDDPQVTTRPIQRTDLPRVAVAICTKDRDASLLETLESIWAQTYLPAELVVIDDGRMPDETWERIAVQCQDCGIEWRYDRTDAPGLTSSRNRAAQIAESEIIQYLDDDVTCDSAFLERVAELFVDERVAGVTAEVSEPKLDSPGGRRFEKLARIARWWALRPTGDPAGPAPEALRDPSVATRAVWMSGAAMAYRRQVILDHPFDERLSEYALGEDREIGYRLMPRYWLLQSKRARVVHRRDVSGRADPRQLGRMTAYNYLYILHKTCRLRGLRRIEPYATLAIMALGHIPGCFGRGARSHALELLGLVEGVAKWIGERGGRPRCRVGVGAADVVHRRSAVAAGRTPARVLFVANRLEPGGAERMLVSLVERLRAHNAEPIVGCLKDAGPLAGHCAASGITVHEELLKFRTDAAVLLRLRRLIKAERIDALVVSQSGGDRMFWTTLAGMLTRVPVVVWSHWFPKAGARHLEFANRALLRFVDRFIALGVAHRDALARIEKVPAGRIAIVPNAIDGAQFATNIDRTGGRQRLGIGDAEFVVGIVANLRKEKRHDVFIEVAKVLAERHADMRFLIVGDGPSRDAVRAAAAASGLGDDVLRLLGPRNDVPEIMAALDACCLCSETECFSVTMLEAAAAGCPFIAPLVGGMGEFLKHGQTGLAIRPADAASLADAVSELRARPALGAALVRNARAALSDGFELDGMAGKFAVVLREAIGERGEDRTLRDVQTAGRAMSEAWESARQLDCRRAI